MSEFWMFPAMIGEGITLAALFVLLMLMSVSSRVLSFLCFMAVMYFLVVGASVVVTSMTAGWVYMLAWLLLIVTFCYGIGKSQSKKDNLEVGFFAITLATLAMVTYYYGLDFSLVTAVFYTAMTSVLYLFAGFWFSYLWKWNELHAQIKAKFFDQQKLWMMNLRLAIESNPEAPQVGNRGSFLNADEIAAMQALADKTPEELGRMAMPQALAARWGNYRIDHNIAVRWQDYFWHFFSWMMGWPGILVYDGLHKLVENFSKIVEAIGRTVTRFFKWMYAKVGGMLRRAQERIFADRMDLLDLPERQEVVEGTPPPKKQTAGRGTSVTV